ncbi:MAG: ATP-binding protein [Candidatus Baltobacteraceae bacterium]
MRRKAIVAWSSGKDSAFALYETLREGAYDVAGIMTTVTPAFGRISVHGVRRELLAQQAACLGLASTEVSIPYPCPNAAYESAMAGAFAAARDELGVSHVIFGDLYLADIRAYRERQMSAVGLTPVFPLWMRDTRALAHAMFAAKFEAQVVAVDAARLDASFAGRAFDAQLLHDLPAGIDPCGENGEFHTFVTAAPIFARRVSVRAGGVVLRDGAYYADLLSSKITAHS